MLALVSLAVLASGTGVVVVAPNGDDQGEGSAARPYRTLTRALQDAKPGDAIRLRGGTYHLTEPLQISAQGEPGRWITVEAFRGERPIFDLTAAKARDLGHASSQGGLNLKNARWIRLVSLEVRSSPFAGILAHNCEGLDIANCRLDGSFAPGIGVWNSKQVRVIGNRVTRANAQAFRQHGNPRFEAPHEAISIAGVDGFEVSWNRVFKGDKEGIDVKEVSRNGVVHHNYVHDMPRQGLYVDAWFGLLENVRFVSNVVDNCEWGMVVSVEGRGSELRNVEIAHNLIRRARGSGIYFGVWGTDGPRSNLRILHNTVLDCGTATHWAGPTGSIDLRSKNARAVLVERNIAAGGASFELATFTPDKKVLDERAYVATENLLRRPIDPPLRDNPYGLSYRWDGERSRTGDPEFRNPQAGDYRIKPGGRAAGLGAFPGESRTLPKVGPRFPDWPAVRPPTGDLPALVGRP